MSTAPCSAQHAAEKVFRILEIGDEVDLAAPGWQG
jgi:hypothetical protein